MATKKKNIYVNGINQVPLPKRQIEIVERKGIGHPDSVADNIAETVSECLCRMYKDEVGHVLHHNTDQTEVVAGRAQSKFKGGDIIKPVYVLMDGRATTSIVDKKGNVKELPVDSTALKGVRKMMKKVYPYLDLEEGITFETKLGQGSDDLCGVYKASNYLSNDTSFGVGYAPFSVTDNLTRETEYYINGALKKTIPEAGQDVKVMCSRVGKDITMTIACAMVDRFIDDKTGYASSVEHLRNAVYDNALKIIDKSGEDINLTVDVNTGDDLKRDVLYMTVTGLSQENGDDGSVGRGNRCNGLITPFRPMSMEATSGKNPITHVGKIYNVLSTIIAQDVAKKIKGDNEVHVRILSQIGHTISDPLNCAIDIINEGADSSKKLPKWQDEAYQIAADWLDNIDKVSENIILGKIKTF